MSKGILTLSYLETKVFKIYSNKTPIFVKDRDSEKLLVSNKIYLVKKTISTLFKTCMMMKKLSYYI